MLNKDWWKTKWKNNADFVTRDMTAFFRNATGQSQWYTSPYPNAQPVPLGNAADPNKYNVLYNTSGRRFVFYKGDWQEDDPGSVYNSGIHLQPPPMRYKFMDANGNYLDESGRPVPQGSLEWLQLKWGDVPGSAIENLAGDEFDATPDEILSLEDMEEHRYSYSAPSLVKIGKPPTDYGKPFYINGQKAIMGKPDGNRMQYAVTQSGEGDRWKYKIVQDNEGNWVRTYYRSYGAKKEKELRLKKKGKD